VVSFKRRVYERALTLLEPAARRLGSRCVAPVAPVAIAVPDRV
jgi:hypothetical protein